METWPGPGFGILVPLKSCGLPTSSPLSPMWTRWTTQCQLPPQGGQGAGPRIFERLLRLAGTGSGYQIGKHGTTNGQVLIFKFFSTQSPILIDQDVLIFWHWSTYSWQTWTGSVKTDALCPWINVNLLIPQNTHHNSPSEMSIAREWWWLQQPQPPWRLSRGLSEEESNHVKIVKGFVNIFRNQTNCLRLGMVKWKECKWIDYRDEQGTQIFNVPSSKGDRLQSFFKIFD